MTWTPHSRFARYGTAILATASALVLSLFLYPITQRIPTAFFLGAVAFSAAYGGLKPGIMATVLSVIFMDYFLIPPDFAFSFHPDDILMLGVFGTVATFISTISESRRRIEHLLNQQRESLRVTLSSIGDAVIATDAEGYVTFMNPVAEELTGWKYEHALGVRIGDVFNIINETTAQSVDNPVFRVLKEGVIVGLANHTILLSKNGSRYPIDDSGAPIRDERGKLIGAVLTFRDITQRRHSENVQEFLLRATDELAKSLDYEATLKTIAHLAIPAIADWCVIDIVENGELRPLILTSADPVMQKRVEALRERLRNDPQVSDRPNPTKHVVQNGQTIFVPQITESMIEASGDPETQELLRLLRLTSMLYVPMIVRGQVMGVLSFSTSGRQLVERDRIMAEELARRSAVALENARLFKDAQMARQSAEQATVRTMRLQQVTASLSRALTPFEVAEVFVEQGTSALNATGGVIAGLRDNNVVTTIYAKGYSEEIVDQWREYSLDSNVPLTQAMKSREPLWIESLDALTTTFGILPQPPYQSWAVLPLLVGDRVIGGIGFSFLEDRQYSDEEKSFMSALANQCAQALDRARLYREAQEAIRARDEFFSVAAHELRTPITSLRGFAQTLMRQLDRGGGVDPKQLNKALITINEQSIKLTTLVNQLLDVSRVEAGRLSLVPKPTNLNALLRNIITTAQSNTDHHSLTLNATTEVVANVDVLRLEQVIVNLIDNAIKYSPDGGPVNIELTTPNSDTARIAITDRGIGIPPERRPHIFNRFYQAHSSRYLGGMGLGLYISRQIIELHRGTLDAEFPEEGGTRFVITLPCNLETTLETRSDAIS